MQAITHDTVNLARYQLLFHLTAKTHVNSASYTLYQR